MKKKSHEKRSHCDDCCRWIFKARELLITMTWWITGARRKVSCQSMNSIVSRSVKTWENVKKWRKNLSLAFQQVHFTFHRAPEHGNGIHIVPVWRFLGNFNWAKDDENCHFILYVVFALSARRVHSCFFAILKLSRENESIVCVLIMWRLRTLILASIEESLNRAVLQIAIRQADTRLDVSLLKLTSEQSGMHYESAKHANWRRSSDSQEKTFRHQLLRAAESLLIAHIESKCSERRRLKSTHLFFVGTFGWFMGIWNCTKFFFLSSLFPLNFLLLFLSCSLRLSESAHTIL